MRSSRQKISGRSGKERVTQYLPPSLNVLVTRAWPCCCRFLVFAGTFELVIVGEYGLPYVLGRDAEIDF